MMGEQGVGGGGDGGGGSRGLDVKAVALLCFIQLCDFINGGAIYPYVIFLVKSFHLTDDDRNLGYYAGILASSYFIAQLLSRKRVKGGRVEPRNLPWGIASDRFGRRPCLLFGLFSSIVTVLCFGFSTSFTFAIITRFLSGLFNGNLGTTKTMLGELSTTETQARAFSYFSFTVAVSGVVGPIIGGTLSMPTEKYPSIFGGVSLFEKYPFCLPNLVVGSLSTIGFIIGLFVLPETKAWKDQEDSTFIAKILSLLPFRKSAPQFHELKEVGADTTTEDGQEEQEEQKEAEDLEPTAGGVCNKLARWCATTKFRMLKDRGVAVSCSLYAILGFMWVFYEEMVPFWSSLEVSEGGLKFSSTDIGIITSVGCGIGMIFQLFVYPRMAKKVKVVQILKIGAIVTMPGMLLLPQIPAIAYAVTKSTELNNQPVTWALLLVALLFTQIGGELLFVSVMIAISNSAEPEMMGTVNGLAQTLVALTRSVAPVAGGSMLSWALTNGLSFPFNHQFPFIIFLLLCVLVLALTHYAPVTLNMQKKEALQKEREAQNLLKVEISDT